MSANKYCLALDLKNDPKSIREYERHHQKVWPEVVASIEKSGINSMEIYRIENRLFMIIEAGPGFSFEEKERIDNKNRKVQEWEKLMWNYQQAIPHSKPGEKWRLMKNIFTFQNSKSL